MPTKATCLKILREARGVPEKALLPTANILECGVHRSTVEDWRWLNERTKHKRLGKLGGRQVQLRQDALLPYCGKLLIYACIEAKDSIFVIFIEPKKKVSIFWEERRRGPNGRLTTRCR